MNRPTATLAVALLAPLALFAERQVINGQTYECEGGLCRLVEPADKKIEPPRQQSSAEAPKLAQGYLNANEFLAFLQTSNSQTSNFKLSNPQTSNSQTSNSQTSNFKLSNSQTFKLSNFLSLLLFALLGGLALNLTPCVLPMIPVNLMVIGRSAARGTLYALGMFLSYGVLGLAAALGGLAFGDIQSSPYFNGAVALVFAALALALGGVFSLDFTRFRPSTQRLARGTGASFAFFMGVLSAVLAGACVAPVLVSVLMLTAKLYGSGVRAALALPFALGLGLALPWPFLGAGLKLLPKPGAWMIWVNRAFAVVVLGLSVWHATLAVRGFGGPSGARTLPTEQAALLPEQLEGALKTAKRPVLVDFGASWCKNCAAMEKTTLADERVRRALKGWTILRVRCEDLKALRALPGYEKVIGLPAFAIYAQ